MASVLGSSFRYYLGNTSSRPFSGGIRASTYSLNIDANYSTMIPYIYFLPTSWQKNISTQGQDASQLEFIKITRTWRGAFKWPSDYYVSRCSYHPHLITFYRFVTRRNFRIIFFWCYLQIWNNKIQIKPAQIFDKSYQTIRGRF